MSRPDFYNKYQDNYKPKEIAMKIMSICAALMISLSFTACAVHTPEGSIIVDPDRSYYPSWPRRFLPTRTGQKRSLLNLKPSLCRRLFITYIHTILVMKC